MKDELGEKIQKEFTLLTAKTYSYLTNNNDKDKNQKHKKCVVKRKLKFEEYKHYLEATQLEIKINHLEKNTLNIDNLQENHKEFIKAIN